MNPVWGRFFGIEHRAFFCSIEAIRKSNCRLCGHLWHWVKGGCVRYCGVFQILEKFCYLCSEYPSVKQIGNESIRFSRAGRAVRRDGQAALRRFSEG